MLSDSLHYQAFVSVVETQSISASARALGLARPTLSRRLQRLEADLGVPLLTRTTRRVLPTRTGERLYQRIRPLLQSLHSVEQDLLDEASEPRGTLRVSVPPLIAASMAPICAQLHQRFPKLSVELVATLRFVDLSAEGFDVALRAGLPRDADLISRPLFPSRIGAVAAPDYLATTTPLHTLADLTNQPLLLGHTQTGQPRTWWPTLDGGRIRVNGRFVTDDRQLLKEMALAGQGIALLSEHNCGQAIANGRLQWVLPDLIGATMSLHVVYPQRHTLPPRVRAFVHAVVTYFAGKAPAAAT